ncbi:MAG: SDR family NAD(P)-dependent oxidoreductase [SAR324 cluster bacterium]|nr:SDR family NAD(P)-dependent oxidoreductase [SAR324 cluster bacterium]
MTHSAFQPNAVAVITGGASGIGLATAQHLAAMGLRLVIVDVREALLEPAAEQLRQLGAPEVMASSTDVSDREALVELETLVAERFGGTDILMNNAGIQPGSSLLDDPENWLRILGVNLGGIVYGTQVFVPRMIERGRPGLVINTGSKQGITTPPGDPAYNVSKSGVKTFTEALAHELRNTEGHQLTAHLLIPGFVFTDLTRGSRTEKPTGAWTPEQTAEFLFQSVERGDFYILCPDNDVSRELDEKRMAWAIGDVIENRPPLSRWHPDYAESFNLYIDRS